MAVGSVNEGRLKEEGRSVASHPSIASFGLNNVNEYQHALPLVCGQSVSTCTVSNIGISNNIS